MVGNKIYIKRKEKILFLLLMLCSSFSFAQDMKLDLKKMGESYQKAEIFAADLTIEVQYTENTPLQIHQNAKIRKVENNFYYALGNSETIITDHLLIMVNKGNKSIFVRALEEKEQELIAKKYYTTGIDSVVSRYDSAIYIGTGKYGKQYDIFSAKQMIEKTSLFLDSSTGYISKVIYGYNKKISKELYKVVITFVYPDHTNEDEKLLKEATYLVKVGTSYKPAPKYLNYEINKVDNE